LDRVIYVNQSSRVDEFNIDEFKSSEIYDQRLTLRKATQTILPQAESSYMTRVSTVHDSQISEGEEEDEQLAESPELSAQIIKEEDVASGEVSWSTYKELFSFAFGGIWGIVLVIVLHVMINACAVAVSLYLAFTLTFMFDPSVELSPSEKEARNKQYNIFLLTIICIALVSSFIGKIISNKIFMSINRRLHDRIVKRVLNANIRFFEENPQGRILNRFSKDIATLDNLVFCFLEMTDYIVKCFYSVFIVISIVPYLIIVAFFSFIYLIRLRK
jgi:hypothetical protein